MSTPASKLLARLEEANTVEVGTAFLAEPINGDKVGTPVNYVIAGEKLKIRSNKSRKFVEVDVPANKLLKNRKPIDSDKRFDNLDKSLNN